MSRVRWFANLPAEERGRLVRALVVLAMVRIALWVLPFRLVRRFAVRLANSIHSHHSQRSGTAPGPAHRDLESTAAAHVSWAVERAGRFVPGATCLVRALAAQALLAHEGVASTLRFGVTRGGGNEFNQFRAHAWLECAGRVVVGGDEDLSRFSPLPRFI